MQSNYDPETASYRWFSPAYHTTSVKWSSPFTSKMFLEAGWSSNLEYYTNSYQEGVEEPRGTAAWFAKASRNDLDLGNLKTAPQSRITESPARYAMMGAVTYLLGQHNLKFGMQSTWGSFTHTRDANGDLVQQYPQHLDRHPLHGARQRAGAQHAAQLRGAVELRPGLLRPGFVDLQPPDDQRRPALREGEGAGAGGRVPGRPVRAGPELRADREPAQLEQLRAPLRDGLRPVRQRQDGAEVLDQPLQPGPDHRHRVAGTTRCSTRPPRLQWRDVNGDDIAQGERGCNYGTAGTPGCEINFAQLPANFGIAALATYGDYPRTWNLEQGAEIQHELLPNLSLAGSWYRGAFKDLTVSLNQSWSTADYTPYTLLRPAHRRAVHGLRAERGRAGAAREIPRHLRSGTEAPVRGIQSGVPVSPLRRRPAVRRCVGRADARDVLHRAGRPELRVDLGEHRDADLQHPASVRRDPARHPVAEDGQAVGLAASRLGAHLQRGVPVERAVAAEPVDQQPPVHRDPGRDHATRPTARRRARPARWSCRRPSSRSRA